MVKKTALRHVALVRVCIALEWRERGKGRL